MEVVRTVQEVRRIVKGWRSGGARVGLVPTMGALHDGHLALIDRARAACDRTMATVFVNPLQFSASEDFDRYPRVESRDAALLAARGCDVLFAPGTRELYPDGARVPDQFATRVDVEGLSGRLCGAFRPGHFAGSATVVMKLFMIGLPDVAFFGEKDFQQLQIIRRMVAELNVPVDVAGVETVREPDGLAMSSRNAYLNEEERRTAPLLFAVLGRARDALLGGAEAPDVLARAREALLAGGFTPVDYVSLIDPQSLEALTAPRGDARLAAAAWLGTTRLIDNIPLT